MKRKGTCSCRGRSGERKQAYRTRQAAVSAGIRRGGLFRTYPCPAGAGWHLTHG